MPEVVDHLHAAADRYREEALLAEDELAASLSGEGRHRQDWLSDGTKRNAGARLIRQMLREEAAAVAEIKKALALLG